MEPDNKYARDADGDIRMESKRARSVTARSRSRSVVNRDKSRGKSLSRSEIQESIENAKIEMQQTRLGERQTEGDSLPSGINRTENAIPSLKSVISIQTKSIIVGEISNNDSLTNEVKAALIADLYSQ